MKECNLRAMVFKKHHIDCQFGHENFEDKYTKYKF